MVKKGESLFPRIDVAKELEALAELGGAKKSEAPAESEAKVHES